MFDPMLAYQTFESTSLTELNEREKSGPRKYLQKLVTQVLSLLLTHSLTCLLTHSLTHLLNSLRHIASL
jgi:hypothetical protein